MKFLSHTKEEAFEIIKELVARFKQNEKSYTSVSYDESNTRTDFIDKFFEALNWDVRNDNGFAERFREVVREDKVVINGQTKAPDYSFRLGGQKIFFVEAKKPSVNIKDDIAPAYQVRRYAYTAKLPLSILTDFEEFAVYDTQIKPNSVDKASTARIQFMRYTEYEENFEYLWNTFSKDAVQTGSFDRYCESSKNKRGTSEIDNELLSTIEKWRLDLAKNIALRNPSLNLRNLNIAVQKIIDRIIFLRIAEDKDMEDLETLKKACNSENAYESLKRVFSIANDKYNSGLFATESWIENLVIDSKVLKDITNELYYPNCPYAWVALPVEVLGNIYEKFLGSEINFKNVKNGHTVTVEEKPEIKKAGGVFYTPTYIVKYIVEQTIGKKLANCTPETASSVTVCDPACGSGSFLVGAFKFILNWYLDQYTKSKTEEAKNLKAGKIINTKNGIALSIQEKKRILTTHIFGVDIDAQAVEVTKLSLFLQMLEGEGKQENSLFRESDMHVLPYLGDNIKCGNSLIGSDFYATQDLSLFEEDAMYKVNAFDWDKEFPQIFGKNCHTDSILLTQNPEKVLDKSISNNISSTAQQRLSGFECVIGNPPYVSAPNMVSMMPEQREAIAKSPRFKTLYQKWDLYIPFIEMSLDYLKEGGLYSAIIPYPFTNQTYGKLLREKIINEYNLIEVADLNGTKIFDHATVSNCIPVIEKAKPSGKCLITHIDEQKQILPFIEQPYEKLVQDEKSAIWNLTAEDRNTNRHADMHVLGDFCYISVGMVLNADEKTAKGEFSKEDLISTTKDEIHCREYIEAKDVGKYKINRIRYLEYNTERVPNKIRRPTFRELYNTPKLVMNCLGTINTALDSDNHFLHNHSIYCGILWKDLHGVENKSISSSIKKFSTLSREEMESLSETVDLKYLLAIMNSRYASVLLTNLRGGDYHIYPEHIRNIPIPTATESQQQELANLATLMMEAVKKQQDAKSEQEKNICKMRVEAIDTQINAKVYALYGLTEDEIAIVEKSK